MNDIAEIAARIQERLALKGISERDASLKVTGKPDMIRDIKRGRMPGAQRLNALAELLGVSSAWLIDGAEREAETAEEQERLAERGLPFRPHELPRDIPVYGTALGHDLSRADDGLVSVETTTFEMGDVVDWFRRPPVLAGRRDVYGLYVVGSSMAPRFEPGDPVYVDPRRPPAIGDYVIVQLAKRYHEVDGEIITAMIKRLARRSASFIELEQFEPRGTFKVEIGEIASIHRVMTMGDLMAV